MIREENKVGIVTLFGRYNYGNRLQNFAVTRIWQQLGFSPETLVLAERPSFPRSFKRVAKHILGRPESPSIESLMSVERLAAFDRFNERIPTRGFKTIERDLWKRYSLFSVGSDQVWNPGLMGHDEDWYFLEFAKRDQRIALAPSIGASGLEANQARRLADGVMGFPQLSVREQRGAELIKQCSGLDAEVICDPTLVIPSAEWRSVADGRVTPDDPYVLTYLLGGRTGDADWVLSEVTDDGRIPTVSLTDREQPGEPPAGPAEFIDLIDHASHVVTDSFHAAVFSCLMETPLTIVKRGGDGGGMFSRLETLADQLDIKEKVCGSDSFDLKAAGTYRGTSDRVSEQRDHFMEYLEFALDNR